MNPAEDGDLMISMLTVPVIKCVHFVHSCKNFWNLAE